MELDADLRERRGEAWVVFERAGTGQRESYQRDKQDPFTERLHAFQTSDSRRFRPSLRPYPLAFRRHHHPVRIRDLDLGPSTATISRLPAAVRGPGKLKG
jgi:hypothetical protein